METLPRTWNGLWPSCQPHCSWQIHGGWHHKHFIRRTSVIRLSAGKSSCLLWQLVYDEASINTFALFHLPLCVFLKGLFEISGFSLWPVAFWEIYSCGWNLRGVYHRSLFSSLGGGFQALSYLKAKTKKKKVAGLQMCWSTDLIRASPS